MPFFQTMLVTLLALSSFILGNASPVPSRNSTVTIIATTLTTTICPSSATLTTTIGTNSAKPTITGTNTTALTTTTGTSSATNVPQPTAFVASDRKNPVPAPQRENEKPGDPPNQLMQMNDLTDDIPAKEDRLKGDKPQIPKPEARAPPVPTTPVPKPKDEKSEEERAKAGKAKHTCAALTEQALQSWQDKCDHFFAKLDTDCWNRAPRMDRCCNLPKGKKPYGTCSSFLDGTANPDVV